MSQPVTRLICLWDKFETITVKEKPFEDDGFYVVKISFTTLEGDKRGGEFRH